MKSPLREYISLAAVLLPTLFVLFVGDTWFLMYNDSQRQITVIRSIVNGGMVPPKETLMEGYEVVYPWAYHLMIAATQLLTGFPIPKLFEVISMISFYLLFAVLFIHLRKKTKAPVTAAMLAVYGCNFAWLFFLKDLTTILFMGLPFREVMPGFYFNSYTDSMNVVNIGKINYLPAVFSNPQLNGFALLLFFFALLSNEKRSKILFGSALLAVHPVFFILVCILSPLMIVAGFLALPFILTYMAGIKKIGGVGSTLIGWDLGFPVSIPFEPIIFLMGFGTIGIAYILNLIKKPKRTDIIYLIIISINNFMSVWWKIAFQPFAVIQFVENEKIYKWVDRLWFLGILTPVFLWFNIGLLSNMSLPVLINSNDALSERLQVSESGFWTSRAEGFEQAYWARLNTKKTWIDNIGINPRKPIYLAMMGSEIFVSSNLAPYYGESEVNLRLSEMEGILNDCKDWEGYILDSNSSCGRPVVFENSEGIASVG